MSIGWKFYVKYVICFIPLLILAIPLLFLPPPKRAKYNLKNKFGNIMTNWIFK